MSPAVCGILDSFLALKTPNTERTYRTSLMLWCEFLAAPLETERGLARFLDARAHEAVRFLALMKREGRADATVRQRYHALSSIYAHLRDLEIAPRNPFAQAASSISLRQQNQVRPTAMIPAEKVQELLDAPARNTKDGIRDRALLAILFGGGLRRSEAVALDVGSVGVTQAGRLYLMLRATKDGKGRDQPLPPWAVEQFNELVIQRKGEGAENRDPLFVTYYADGTPSARMSVDTLYRTFKRWCRVCNFEAAPHAARAAAATMLKELGYEDREVAEFLGHASEAMVRTYDKRGRGPDRNAGLHLVFSRKTSKNPLRE